MTQFIITLFLIILLLALAFSCANVVPQEHAYVIERLGRYKTTWDAGLHFKYRSLTDLKKGSVKGTGRGLRAAAGYHQR